MPMKGRFLPYDITGHSLIIISIYVKGIEKKATDWDKVPCYFNWSFFIIVLDLHGKQKLMLVRKFVNASADKIEWVVNEWVVNNEWWNYM